MRDYGKIAPTFWTRGSGKKLRGDKDARILAAYVMTAPMSNMIGLYYLPESTIMHDTGLTHDEVTRALSRLAQLDIAFYDAEHEMVWVPKMAHYQVGESIKASTGGKPDNRIVPLRREVGAVGEHPFLWDFYARYAGPYNLARPPFLEALQNPFQHLKDTLTKGLPGDGKGLLVALPKGLVRAPGLQEQEQEHNRSSSALPETPAAALVSETDLADIRDALGHPSFASIPDLDAVACDRLDRFRTIQASKPIPLAWFLAAIAEAASDCTGTGMTPAEKVRKVRQYSYNPKRPRELGAEEPADEVQPADPYEQEAKRLAKAVGAPPTAEQLALARAELAGELEGSHG